MLFRSMLSLAKNQLTSSDYSELTKQVPGVNKLAGAGALGQLSQLGGLLGKSSGVSETATSAVSNVANTDQLNSAFSALGMQDGMVAKFAPVTNRPAPGSRQAAKPAPIRPHWSSRRCAQPAYPSQTGASARSPASP